MADLDLASSEQRCANAAIGESADFITRLLLILFIVACVFDPADRIFGAKVWLFMALWGAAVAVGASSSRKIWLPIDLLLIVLIFIAIPLVSIVRYYFVSGSEPYAGFTLFKGYLFASLAIVLVLSRFDVVPIVARALTVIALLTIAISLALRLYPPILSALRDAGEHTGVLILFERTYGQDLSIMQVTFATAPMLAISIAYYFDRVLSGLSVGRFKSLALLAVNVAGMLLAGLRNTIAVALLLPLFLWPFYTRRIARNMLVTLGILVVFSLLLISKLKILLDPAELSNGVKLTFLQDYITIFSDPWTLIFGQGLGAYYRWSSSGQPNFDVTGANFYFITELTYAEMIRSFGVIGALVMVALLLYPVACAFLASSDSRRRALAIGFVAYLCMSATNPLLFSSSGMLIWTILLADTSMAITSRTTSVGRSLS